MWIEGRQGTGYHKLPLVRTSILDLYILRYQEGSYIPYHTDPIPNRRHYRVNVELKRAECGGEFEGDMLFHWGRLRIFRSDRPHAVGKIQRGERYVLSLGVAL